MSISVYIFILALLIFLHELGHFWAARHNDIVVDEFGLGLPPKMVSLGRWQGTEFTLNLLPFGGFARMKGEDMDMGPGSFWSAPARARATVLLAGPFMNILAAVVFLTVSSGLMVPPNGLWVLAVSSDFPAAEEGLMSGDIIESVNGEPITSHAAFVQTIRQHANRPVTLTVRRDGERLQVVVQPKVDPRDGVPRIGVILTQRPPLWQAPLEAARDMGRFIWELLVLPGRLIRGQVSAEDVRPVGPVGIGRFFVAAVNQMPDPHVQVFTILRLTGIISFALGITNLLPLPGLDGGRLVFVVLEILRRGKRISPTKEGLVHLVGMALLLTLMAVITYYDLRYPPDV